MQKRFGSLEFSTRSLGDATRLAEEGFPIGEGLVRAITASRQALSGEAMRDVRQGRGGAARREPPEAGTARQHAEGDSEGGPGPRSTAAVLRRRSREEMTRAGSRWREEDLAAFESEWCEPLKMRYRGDGRLRGPTQQHGGDHPPHPQAAREGQHPFARTALRREGADDRGGGEGGLRYEGQGARGPRFGRFSLDDFLRSRGDAGVQKKIDKADTTYFAVADDQGNVLSCIQAFHHFGSRVFLEDSGFFLNNRGSAFAMEGPNRVEPERGRCTRSRRSCCSRDGKPVSPDGRERGRLQAAAARSWSRTWSTTR